MKLTSFENKALVTKDEVAGLAKEHQLTDTELINRLLTAAAKKAVTPVSGFNVGVLAVSSSGNYYFGANIEFEGVPLGESVHAEQAAIANAYLHGERELTAIAVNAAPCGLCRQFMRELHNASDLNILVKGKDEAGLCDLLPQSFGPDDLGIEAAFMKEINHEFGMPAANDSLTLKVVEAANISYAPYTKAYAGAAVEMNNGEVYGGCYIENAAYNPSLKPLQCAVISLIMNGGELQDMKRAVLAEKEDAKISHYEDARALLQRISGIELEKTIL